MENNRREFLKLGGITWLGITGGGTLKGFAAAFDDPGQPGINLSSSNTFSAGGNKKFNESNLSIIGLYGEWANALTENKLPAFSL